MAHAEDHCNFIIDLASLICIICFRAVNNIRCIDG